MALTEIHGAAQAHRAGTFAAAVSRLLTRLWDSNPRYRRAQALAKLSPEQFKERGVSRQQALCRVFAISLRP